MMLPISSALDFTINYPPNVEIPSVDQVSDDSLFSSLYRNGFIDSNGNIVQEKFQGIDLPPLNSEQIDEIHKFLTNPFKIHRADGVLLCEIKLEEYFQYLTSNNPQITSIEIVGGFVRKLLTVEYCEEAFKLLDIKITESSETTFSDYDIRVMTKGDPVTLRDSTVRYLAMYSYKSPTEIIESAFTKYALVRERGNYFGITTFGDVEVLFINSLERQHLFTLDALRIPITNPLHIVSDCLGGWQSIIDILTKNIHIQDVNTVNSDGPPMLMSWISRGYTCSEVENWNALTTRPDISLVKCLKNHYRNDPLGAFAVIFNSNTYLKTALELPKVDLDDPVLSTVIENSVNFEVVYSLLHIAAFKCLGGGPLSVTVKTHLGRLALQIQVGKYFILQPLDLEMAYQIAGDSPMLIDEDFSLPEYWKELIPYFPSDDVLLDRVSWINYFVATQDPSLCQRAYFLWSKLEGKVKKRLASELIQRLIPLKPGIALSIMKEFPQDIQLVSALIASFQQSKELNISIENLSHLVTRIILKKRKVQKTPLNKDPFTDRLHWVIDQCINADRHQEGHRLLALGLNNGWLLNEPSVQKSWVLLCQRTLAISPKEAAEYYMAHEKVITLPPEDIEVLIDLAEKVFHDDPGTWVRRVHQKVTVPEFNERVETLVQSHLAKLIENHTYEAVEKDLQLFKGRITEVNRCNILIDLLEDQLEQGNFERAGITLIRLSQINLSDKDRIINLIEKFPNRITLSVPNILPVSKRIELILQNMHPSLSIILLKDVLSFEDGSKIPEALPHILRDNSSTELLISNHSTIVESLKKADQPQLLFDLLIHTKQGPGIYFEWISSRIPVDKTLSILEFEENLSKEIIAFLHKPTHNLMNFTALGRLLLRCPTSNYCEHIALRVHDKHLSFELLMHSLKPNWKYICVLVSKITERNLKEKAYPAICKLQKDSSEDCKRTWLIVLNILIELKDKALFTFLREKNDAQFMQTLLIGTLPLLPDNPSFARDMIRALRVNFRPDIALIAFNMLLKKKNQDFFRLFVELFNDYFHEIIFHLKDKNQIDDFYIFVIRIINYWDTNIPRELVSFMSNPPEVGSFPRANLHASKVESPTVSASSHDYYQFIVRSAPVILASENTPLVRDALESCFEALINLNVVGKDSATYSIIQKLPDFQHWDCYFEKSFELIGSSEKAMENLDIFIEHHGMILPKHQSTAWEAAFDYFICHMVTVEKSSFTNYINKLVLAYLNVKIDQDPSLLLHECLKSIMTKKLKPKIKKVLLLCLSMVTKIEPITDTQSYNIFIAYKSILEVFAEVFPHDEENIFHYLIPLMVSTFESDQEKTFLFFKNHLSETLNNFARLEMPWKERLGPFMLYYEVTGYKHSDLMVLVKLRSFRANPFFLSHTLDILKPHFTEFLKLGLGEEFFCNLCMYEFEMTSELLSKMNSFYEGVDSKLCSIWYELLKNAALKILCNDLVGNFPKIIEIGFLNVDSSINLGIYKFFQPKLLAILDVAHPMEMEILVDYITDMLEGSPEGMQKWISLLNKSKKTNVIAKGSEITEKL